MVKQNLEETLRRLAEQAAQASDEAARQDLQSQLQQIQAQLAAEPECFLQEPRNFTELYQPAGFADVEASLQVKGKLGKVDSSSVSRLLNKYGECFVPYSVSSLSQDLASMRHEEPPAYADIALTDHLNQLISKLKKSALEAAKQRNCDAVLIRQEGINISGDISGWGGFSFAMWLGLTHDIAYHAHATAELYKRK